MRLRWNGLVRRYLIVMCISVAVLTIVSALFIVTPVKGAELSAAAAQPSYTLENGMNEFGIWAGGSPDSSDFIGKTRDRSLVLVGLRYGRVLRAWESVSLQYTFDILPAAFVFESNGTRSGDSTIYGAGLSPLGFKLNFGQQSWIKPFVAASVGFLYFEDEVPVPRSSRLNFTPELGFGAQFFLAPKRAVTFGYKFHHISNGGIERRNPGMDSHVIYAGFSFFTP